MSNYAVRAIAPGAIAWLRADRQRRELRSTGVTMAAVLASYGTALLVERLAHLQVDVVVLAVVLAVTLARTQQGRGLRARLGSMILLPGVAVATAQVATLMVEHPHVGDALFTVAVSAAIWVRRFGPAYTRAGTIATLPFIALLVTPVPATSGHSHPFWSALIALIAVCWVTIAQLADQHLLPSAHRSEEQPAATARTSSLRPRASTRMAVQMAVALTAAFLVSRHFYPEHWSWMVLTAYIVGAGNRGRRDVATKSVLRLLGAIAGTVAATGLAGHYPAGDKTPVVIIFIVLAVATWLRSISYAFWAAGITAALALLYGYFGQSGASLLRDRLVGIALGALIGVVAAWFILPVVSRRGRRSPSRE